MDLMHSSGEKGQEYPRQRSFSSEDIPEEKLDLYEQQPSTSMNRVLVRSREDVHGTGLRPTPQRTKRPVSMAVPLPSWVNKEDKSDPYSVSSQSIAVSRVLLSIYHFQSLYYAVININACNLGQYISSFFACILCQSYPLF